MKQITITIGKGVPKVIAVDEEMSIMLENAYATSNVYGLGGSTARKLKDYFAKELAEYEALVKENPERNKSLIFCEAFSIYSNESPLLVEALQWVEKSASKEGFSSRMISIDSFVTDNVLGWRLERSSEFYPQLVADFNAWAGKSLVEANLNVSFVRFCKFFYTLIK